MRLMTMHLNLHSKSVDTGTDLYPIYSPTSPTSARRSLCQGHNVSHRRKVFSESISNDLFKRKLRHLSPDSVGTRMFAMPEEGRSSADEDLDLPHSTRSMGPGYLLLTAKDRLKSVSLEWTLSNGALTPRAPHYHTHPPLDFKSLKQKLEQLTGSPDEAIKKHSSGASGHEKRNGALTTIPTTTAVTNPSGGYSAIEAGKKTGRDLESMTSVGADLLEHVPYVSVEPLSRTTSEEDDSKQIHREFIMKLISQLASKGVSSDKFQWSDLAEHVAQKDSRLQEILKRHCQELADMKKRHELQWKELRHRIKESVSEVLQHNEAQQRNSTGDGRDDLPLLSSSDVMPHSPGVSDGNQANEHSLDTSNVVAQPVLSRIDVVNCDNTSISIARWIDGVRNLGGAYGVPQPLPAPVRSQQLATPSMTMLQRLMESQASHQMEPHIWRDLVDRTFSQQKVPPVLLQQVQPLNWYQHLELFQRLQAAGSLEQMMRQLSLQQVSPMDKQAHSVQFRCRRFPNHQCHCARPCYHSQSFPPYIQEHSYSAEPYSFVNWNGCPEISYTPSYGQGLPFPQPSSIQQSSCNEVSSYYCRDNLAFPSNRQVSCRSPDQVTCMLEAARNNLRTASPVFLTTTPPPTPMFSHLIARQSPLSFDGSHSSSVCSSPLRFPLLPPQTLFQFPPDIRQLIFPLNPFAT